MLGLERGVDQKLMNGPPGGIIADGHRSVQDQTSDPGLGAEIDDVPLQNLGVGDGPPIGNRAGRDKAPRWKRQ